MMRKRKNRDIEITPSPLWQAPIEGGKRRENVKEKKGMPSSL
jgi:hypothetical protein